MKQNKKQTDRWQSKEKCNKLKERFGSYDEYAKNLGNRENKPVIFKTIANLVKENGGPLSVLDVGCGPGHFLWTIKDMCTRIVALDNSNYMLELFDQQFNSQRVPYKTILGSCWKIPMRDKEAELVVQMDVCMHIGGSWESLQEMIRVANKYVVFTGPSFENFSDVMDKQIDKISWAVSVPLLTKHLKSLRKEGVIKSFEFIDRPRTKTYNHKILVIKK